MRVAIFADAIVNKGGIERIILSMAQHYKADIYAGKFYPEMTFSEFRRLNVIRLADTYLPQKFQTLFIWWRFSQINLSAKYDLFIFHGAGALNAARKHHPNVWYCHAPSRYIYDLYEEEISKQKGLLKAFYPFVTGIQRRIDQANSRFIDLIMTNSENVRKRVRKYYGLKSVVVYPFVDIKKFKYLGQQDYYLSTARLDPIKRIDLIISAFKKMPDKNLKIASDGIDLPRLMDLAKGSKNITFLGNVSDNDLIMLYGNCIATIFMSYKEDLGMVALESMAAGKPAICRKEGGYKETIIDGKTGVLVENPENIENIIRAVNKMTPEKAQSMRSASEKRAEQFSEEVFLDNCDRQIQKKQKNRRCVKVSCMNQPPMSH
jgi:glycosyltransferase involved in cell wall biosynthesis